MVVDYYGGFSTVCLLSLMIHNTKMVERKNKSLDGGREGNLGGVARIENMLKTKRDIRKRNAKLEELARWIYKKSGIATNLISSKSGLLVNH